MIKIRAEINDIRLFKEKQYKRSRTPITGSSKR